MIRRVALCPCGSGLRYKHCHGSLVSTISLSPPTPAGIPPALLEKLRKLQTEQISRTQKYGDIKEVISATVGDMRFVASGRKLVYSNTMKCFPDFLNQHLHAILGPTLGKQIHLPFDNQHPVIQWRTVMANASMSSPDSEGFHSSDLGGTIMWFRLAYDLYLIEHNQELQKKLLKRIRSHDQFQGARFEAAVAAMMLASGYELEFCDDKLPGKKPEFFARPKEKGPILAIEAKSRRRPGIMGHEPSKTPTAPAKINVDNLLLDAVQKDTVEPLLIFIELNLPTYVNRVNQSELHAELNEAWMRVQAEPWPNGFPAVGVVFYNDVSPWFLIESLRAGNTGTPIWAMVLWPETCRHGFDAHPLLRRIAEGCIQRLTIPQEFPSR